MPKTKKHTFTITNCTGQKLKTVTLRLPIDADPWNYKEKAIKQAGYKQHECDSCYDAAYSACT